MRWRILVSLLSLIICFGVGYAVGRERLRDPDHLHALSAHFLDAHPRVFRNDLNQAAEISGFSRVPLIGLALESIRMLACNRI